MEDILNWNFGAYTVVASMQITGYSENIDICMIN